jgi:hypothetical protein
LWKNPRLVFAAFLVLVLCISLGVEQATKGEYATPTLIGEILKIAIPAFFTAGGLSEVMRYLSRKNGTYGPETQEELEQDLRTQGRGRDVEPNAETSE